MYDWNDLRYFLELSRQGKLRAAARLQVDHTTVSRRITALEKQLDVRLFDKSPRGYQLTDAGLRLLPLAEQIETAVEPAVPGIIAGKDARLGGTVRVATPEALGSQVIARRFAEFRREHPDIEIELVAETRRMSLSKREADIAISFSRPESGRLIAWKLCDYRLRLYAARAYLARHAPIAGVEDLGGTILSPISTT